MGLGESGVVVVKKDLAREISRDVYNNNYYCCWNWTGKCVG